MPSPTGMRSPVDTRKHLASLDGLRGVAAIAVFLHHLGELTGLKQLYFGWGCLSVDFFFVLSGFVIAKSYEHRLANGLGWVEYMGLRLARLYPAIFAGAAIGLMVAVCGGEKIYPALALQFLLLPGFQGAPFPLNPPQWSLFWELWINAVHGVVLRRWAARILIVFVLIMGAWLAFSWNPDSFMGGLPRVGYSFGAGVLIFRAHAAGIKAPQAPYWVIAVALLACTITDSTGFGSPRLSQVFVVLVVLPSLVALAVQSPVPDRQVRFATWLGAISYPLYAVHYPILKGFGLVLGNWTGGVKIAGWCLAGVLTIVLAAMMERFFDAPIRVLLRNQLTNIQPSFMGRRRAADIGR